MPSTPADATPPQGGDIVAAVRDQTHVLLGRTIGYSEDDWAAPTSLPGWTRSHVAAHLVYNARDLLAQITGGASPADEPVDQRAHELELAALANGLNLQIDLDETAGRLDDALASVADPTRIALVRLHEVILHGFDMHPVVEEVVLAPEVANQLLALRIDMMSNTNVPPITIISDEGLHTRLGEGEAESTVSGPALDLLLWLARGVTT